MLPTRDLCSLKALDLASSECLQQLESNLDGLAILLGAKHGEIRYPSPILASQASFTELHQPDPLDAYERRYVTQWLAQLITKLISSDDGLNSRHEQLSDQCAELLAMCAGKMAAGASTKTHTLCTASGTELRIRLRDAALVHDSLGTHTWGAAPILSQLLLPLPESTRNILELGAGTGLVGLATSLWCRLRGHDVQVYLTDYHPQVLENLAYNVALNHLDYSASGVHVRTLDWQRIHEAETSDESAVVTAQTLSSCPPTLSTQTLWQNLLDTELRAQFDMIIAAGEYICMLAKAQASSNKLIVLQQIASTIRYILSGSALWPITSCVGPQSRARHRYTLWYLCDLHIAMKSTPYTLHSVLPRQTLSSSLL